MTCYIVPRTPKGGHKKRKEELKPKLSCFNSVHSCVQSTLYGNSKNKRVEHEHDSLSLSLFPSRSHTHTQAEETHVRVPMETGTLHTQCSHTSSATLSFTACLSADNHCSLKGPVIVEGYWPLMIVQPPDAIAENLSHEYRSVRCFPWECNRMILLLLISQTYCHHSSSVSILSWSWSW